MGASDLAKEMLFQYECGEDTRVALTAEGCSGMLQMADQI